jgi:hypothetical protein
MNPATLANPVTGHSDFIHVFFDPDGNVQDRSDQVLVPGSFTLTLDRMGTPRPRCSRPRAACRGRNPASTGAHRGRALALHPGPRGERAAESGLDGLLDGSALIRFARPASRSFSFGRGRTGSRRVTRRASGRRGDLELLAIWL